MESGRDLTRLLNEAGSSADGWRLIYELVHDELRALAASQMRRERRDHTLQATALVHEAWIRLAGIDNASFESRRHFFGAVARAMQRVLTDHARQVLAEKRGGGLCRMTLSGLDLASGENPVRAIALSDAIEFLDKEDPRAAAVVRMRLYAGVELEDIGRALGMSSRTAAREWAYGRARLVQLMDASH